MKTIKFLTALILAVFLAQCNDFGNLNQDPNNPSEARPELLLTNAQTDISDVLASPATVTSAIWIQYIGENQYTDDSQYATTSFQFDSWYTGPLQDLQTIINLNSDEDTRDNALSGGSNNNQIAVARILKAYFYHMMTDRWGAIPYSEALQGDGNLTPSYDSQPDIYESLITELKEAVNQMDGGEGVKGDILFSGNMGRWAEFANSLRARIALRMAESNETLASAEFADALNEGIIQEDVMYPYIAQAAGQNPWYSAFETREDYAISATMADYMKSLEDYRITRYANPAADLDNKDGTVTFDEINGLEYGRENQTTFTAVSFPGAAIGAGGPGVGQQDAPLPIITLAELNLAMAEAAERGWIAGDAEEFYLAGIEASWNQWNVYDEDNFNDYIARPEVAYDASVWPEKIGTQKWIALFPIGVEAWAEWRRLDYPELVPHPDPLNETGQIPLRHVYPSTETQLNGENYEAAVEAQGPDIPETRLWWDIE